MKILIFLLLCVWLLPTFAQHEPNTLEIELITIASGEYYWEAFGHSAIRIKTEETDDLYGFGYFNFNDEDFFLKFARGDMEYYLGIDSTYSELNKYITEERKVWRQELHLTYAQKHELLKKLNYLSQPENRYYHYDYFLNNCTSQIRDILDEVTDGEISNQLKSINTLNSWNDITFPAINQTWMNLGIAISYGLPAYLDRTQWQLSVFPESFAHDLAEIQTKGSWISPMVSINQPKNLRVYQYSFFKTHYAVLGCIFILLLGMALKLSRKFTSLIWLVLQSLLGIALIMLWFFSKHTVAAYNINVLLFFPIAFVFLFKKLRKRWFGIFLLVNFIWLVLAISLTNLYLIGFCIINFITYTSLRDK